MLACVAVIPLPPRLEDSLTEVRDKLTRLKRMSLDPFPGLEEGVIPLTPRSDRSEIMLEEARETLTRLRRSSVEIFPGQAAGDRFKNIQKGVPPDPTKVLKMQAQLDKALQEEDCLEAYRLTQEIKSLEVQAKRYKAVQKNCRAQSWRPCIERVDNCRFLPGRASSCRLLGGRAESNRILIV